uniref:NnrS family protein n=1 Tax=Rhodoblastus sp. TaxID=1962975 RepID=UPI0035AF8721
FRNPGTSLMRQRAAPPPFALLFPLAALDAIAVGFGWLAAFSERFANWSIADAVEWHQKELLFGFVAAAMAGFLFTALPRWTKRPLSEGAVPAFIGMWAFARFIPTQPWPLGLVQGMPCALLAGVAAHHVIRANDRRNRKTIVLLALYAAAAVVCCGPFAPPSQALAAHVAVAATVALAMLIGGRVLPALTARFDMLCGEMARPPRRRAIEPISAALAIAALASQLLAPEAPWTPAGPFAAGAAQFLRMASWVGRRTFETPTLVALYATYASLPLGFILVAAHGVAPDTVPAAMAIHVWAIGGFGGMVLTIMSSMIRKRCGLAFVVSPGSEAAAALCLVAAAARAGACFWPSLFPVSAVAWTAAFVLFLYAFWTPLFEAAFRVQPVARRRTPQTESHW